jgi:hypothetical protein
MAQAAPRIKGQETSIQVIQNGVVQQSLVDIKSFESEELLTILTEEYLGETTARYDEIYKGFSFRLEAHIETRNYLDFRATVVNKARRRIAGVRINIGVTLQFPGGPRVRVLLKDCHFGPMPLNIPGRSEYVTVQLQGNGESIQIN